MEKSDTKGETPIEKNVIVVDEQGNLYEATYPKRARGLVKNGRARFISENKICLACPPNQYLEETKMEEQKVQTIDTETGEVLEKNKMTPEYALEQIELISKNTGYLTEALQVLSQMTPAGGAGDIAGAEKAQAIGNAVVAREETNRRLIEFYQKLYDELKPQKQREPVLSEDMIKFQQMCDMLSKIDPPAAAEILGRSMQQMFAKAGAEIVK